MSGTLPPTMHQAPTTTALRRLPGGPGPAQTQLAAGEAMLAGLAEAETPSMRWYSFAPAALLLGSGQRSGEVDYAACAAAGIAVHRRGSGGGAVLGRSLLLLDLALPRGHPLFRADVTESYGWFGRSWRDALRSLALEADTVEIERARNDTRRLDPLLRRVCFGGISPYEVVSGERKLVGLAQRRRHGGALFQAAVYLHWEPWATAELMAATPAERELLSARLDQRVAGLDSFEVTATTAAHAVVAAVEHALSVGWGFEIAAHGWLPVELEAQATAIERHRAIEATPASGGV